MDDAPFLAHRLHALDTKIYTHSIVPYAECVCLAEYLAIYGDSYANLNIWNRSFASTSSQGALNITASSLLRRMLHQKQMQQFSSVCLLDIVLTCGYVQLVGQVTCRWMGPDNRCAGRALCSEADRQPSPELVLAPRAQELDCFQACWGCQAAALKNFAASLDPTTSWSDSGPLANHLNCGFLF
jgi:hypothetical protein